jgi:hypothetical protein
LGRRGTANIAVETRCRRVLRRWTFAVSALATRRPAVLLLPMSGGAGLVTHIIAGVSLPLAAGVLLVAGVGAWAATLLWAPASTRRVFLSRVGAGLAGGLIATAAYDFVRYGTVAIFSLSFRPFHVWSVFGRLFIGPEPSDSAAFLVGGIYHVANGVAFSIAFALLVRRPNWRSGVLWGVGLELAMALLYPAWLRIAALQEFLTVSAVGHLVYGSTMGLAVQRILGPPEFVNVLTSDHVSAGSVSP